MNRNIITQAQSATLPQQIGGVYNPTWTTAPEVSLAAGWRIETAQPGSIASGYERLSVRWIQDPNDVRGAIPQYTDTLIATRVAAEAATKAAQLAATQALAQALATGGANMQNVTPEMVARLLLACQTVNVTWLMQIAPRVAGSPQKTGASYIAEINAAIAAQT